MQLAWQQNGLHGPGLKPWHVRATWQFAPSGNKGTWEMWWADNHDYRIETTAPGYRQNRFVNPQGQFITGDRHVLQLAVRQIPQMLLRPVPDWSPLASVEMGMFTHQDQNQELVCAFPKPGIKGLPQFCFTSTRPAIRLVSRPDHIEAAFNSYEQFQGRHIARDIRMVVDKEILNIHVDSLELLPADAVLAPPQQARSAPPLSLDSPGLTAGYPILQGNLNPPIRGQASFMVQFTIRADGTISDPSLIRGPRALGPAVENWVRTWRFIPYCLDDQPVDFVAQISLEFN